MSYFMFAEKISFTKFVGLVIGFLGFIPILLTQSTTEELTGQFFIFSWAEISVVLAATLSVYGWILLKQLVGEAQLSHVFANGASMFIGGSIALIHSALTENWNPLPTSDLGIFIKTTLLLIVVSNLICYNLYGFLLKRYSAVFISFAGFTTPAFTAFFGWLFLNEVVTWPFYLSFFIVIIGMMIFEYDKLKYAELKSVKI